MRTGGYDVVVELGERFPNKMMRVARWMGKFPDMQGKYHISGPLPLDLAHHLRDLEYDVKFDVPTIDFVGTDKVRLSVSSKAVLRPDMMARFPCAIDFRKDSRAVFDADTRRVKVDPYAGDATQVAISGVVLSEDVLVLANEVLPKVFEKHLSEKASLWIGPVLLPELRSWPITVRATKSTDSMLMVGFDFSSYDGGNPNLLGEFTSGKDFAVGWSENGLRRGYDIAQGSASEDGVPVPETIQKSGNIVENVGGTILAQWLLTLLGLAARAQKADWLVKDLGGLEVEILTMITKYDSSIALSARPSIDLLTGNRIRTLGEAGARISATISVVFRVHYKPKRRKKYTRTYTMQVATYSSDHLRLNYSFDSTVNLGKDGRLDVALSNSNQVKLGGLPAITPAALLNVIMHAFVRVGVSVISESKPPIALPSAAIDESVPSTSLSVNLNAAALKTYDEEAIVTANLRIKGIESYFSPPYYGNRRSHEVHLASCHWLHLISLTNIVPYYFLDEVVEDGYHNCYYCKPL